MREIVGMVMCSLLPFVSAQTEEEPSLKSRLLPLYEALVESIEPIESLLLATVGQSRVKYPPPIAVFTLSKVNWLLVIPLYLLDRYESAIDLLIQFLARKRKSPTIYFK